MTQRTWNQRAERAEAQWKRGILTQTEYRRTISTLLFEVAEGFCRENLPCASCNATWIGRELTHEADCLYLALTDLEDQWADEVV